MKIEQQQKRKERKKERKKINISRLVLNEKAVVHFYKIYIILPDMYHLIFATFSAATLYQFNQSWNARHQCISSFMNESSEKRAVKWKKKSFFLIINTY